MGKKLFYPERRTIMKPATTITVILLSLVSIAHLLRLLFQVKIMANAVELPMWPSAPAFIVTAALAAWLWIENKK
jgi:hypothetical protein